MLEVWLPLLCCMVLGATWYHVLRLRERAIVHARQVCEQHGVQFLDDSVSLHRLRAQWRNRTLHVTREYRFDTSLGGHDRRSAGITLMGDNIVGISMPSREQPVPVSAAATAPFQSRTLPYGDGAPGNVIPIERARRTLH